MQGRSKLEFQNRFQKYLDNKLSSDKKERIFGNEFGTLPWSPAPSRRKPALPNHSDFIDYASQFDFSESLNSSYQSINSSRFDPSQYQSAHSASANRKPSPMRRLKKMRDLEENECSICLDQIKDRCRLECKH